MKEVHKRVTKTGLNALKIRKSLVENRYKCISDQIEEISLGEGSIEDAQYYKLKEERLHLQDSLTELNKVLSEVRVVAGGSYLEVGIGSKVKLANHQICHIFRVVESVEANAVSGRISSESPLGKSLIGKKVGQHIQVRAPSGSVTFNVVEIS